MTNLHWKQSISKVEPDRVLLRGYRIGELMKSLPFSSALFLTLTGKLPEPGWDRVLDAMLISAVDHGATPPSVLAARLCVSGGAGINDAIAAGVIAISKHHGGAIDESMEMLYEAVNRVKKKGESEQDVADWIVRIYRGRETRLGGYGHKIHMVDPRTAVLYEIAREAGVDLTYFSMAFAIEAAIQGLHERRVPLNVLGAMAAILCAMGLPPALGSVLFIVSRVPGIAAHAYEEMTREKPLRTIHPTDNEYDGPPERSLDGEKTP